MSKLSEVRKRKKALEKEILSLVAEHEKMMGQLDYFEKIINDKRKDYLEMSDREKVAYSMGIDRNKK